MSLSQLFVPSVYVLIAFLGYPSQWLLLQLEPAPLTKNELIAANVLLACIFITYTKTVFVDPGQIPRKKDNAEEYDLLDADGKEKKAIQSRKWCRKCEAPKPPRAHHCKECKRCIPKMDHHCPWTANCVSHTTFPHFIRFLFYASSGLGYLFYLLYIRISFLWENRGLPAYLGPSKFQIAHLVVAAIANTITLFALFVLFVRNIWCLAVNTTTIEGWEIERHRTLLRRARHFGGFLQTPDGTRVRIEKQEFPYDIGIWANIVQGMGTWNPIAWFNPFHPTPSLSTGLSFPTNDFNSPNMTWPPPDPDRSYRRQNVKPSSDPSEAFTYNDSSLSASDHLAAFQQRQQEDEFRRRKPFVQRLEEQVARDRVEQFIDSVPGDAHDLDEDDDSAGFGSEEEEEEEEGYAGGGSQSGEEGWRNSEGERLKDFGVDEDIEFYDEKDDDVPLGELMARKRQQVHNAMRA